MLALPSSGLPPVDPRPAFHHASRIADEACYVTGDASLQVSIIRFKFRLCRSIRNDPVGMVRPARLCSCDIYRSR